MQYSLYCPKELTKIVLNYEWGYNILFIMQIHLNLRLRQHHQISLLILSKCKPIQPKML